MGTVFGKIVRGEMPCDKVFENPRILAFKDIVPQAPVHILIIPKKEIRCLQDVESEDLPLLGEMLEVAQQLARQLGIEEGYRLVMNNGRKGGQIIDHLHFHLIGGKSFVSHTGLD